MSKFCSQQLPVCKVIPPSGYGSRKAAWLSSSLMGWFGLFLAATLGLAITHPVHADQDCKPINVAFEKWCKGKWQYSDGDNKVTDYNSCMQECYVIMEMYPRQDFEQECLAVGGKFEEENKVTPTCHYDRSPTQNQKQPPQANFTSSPSEGPTPLTVALDGKGSTDDGSITSYQWTTSDGKTASGPTASFVFDKEGDYTITLTVTDNDGLTGSAQQSVTVKGSEIEVISITSKYPKKPHFLDGLNHDVTYVVEINWKELEPGTVSFITPTGTKDVPATGNTAEQTFNMGKDFGVCGKLKVVATSKDGTKSPEKEADFVVMEPISIESATIPFIREDTGNSFSYSLDFDKMAYGLVLKAFELFAPEPQYNTVQSVTNVLSHSFDLRVELPLSITIDSEGNLEGKIKWDNKKVLEEIEGESKKKFTLKSYIGVVEGKLTPSLTYSTQFQDCQWKPHHGSGNVTGELSVSRTQQFFIPLGPIPIPSHYIKYGLSAKADVELFDIRNINPFELEKADATVSAEIKGSGGLGANDILAGEIWLSGGGDIKWTLPPLQLEKPTGGTLTGKGGVSVVAFLWKRDQEIFSCEWDYIIEARINY